MISRTEISWLLIHCEVLRTLLTSWPGYRGANEQVIEMFRRLWLVGLMVVVEPGTTTQLAIGTLLASLFLMVQVLAAPYRELQDDFLASASSFSIVVSFLCAIFFKYSALTDVPAIQLKMSNEQRRLFIISDWGLLTGVLALSVLTTLVVGSIIFFTQLAQEGRRLQQEARMGRLRRLRHLKNGCEAEVPLVGCAFPEQTSSDQFAKLHSHLYDMKAERIQRGLEPLPHAGPFHAFLSHNWEHGQSEMRIVKERLRVMLPDISVFLE